MKNKVFYNKEEVKLTGEEYDFMFEIEHKTGHKEFIHIDDLYIHRLY